MKSSASFGYWLRRRRKALDLTQEELAQRVGCSAGMIRMIEADGRRPSKQMAERLADCLALELGERIEFVKAARAELAPDRLTSPLPARPAPSETLPAGDRHLGRLKGYELLEHIGSGSFGMVYRAYQPGVGRAVAIKIILPEYANRLEFIRRFEAEAQRIALLEHPHIVPLYDYWREPDGAYLVMRYVRGGNLQKALRAGPWSIDATIRLLEQVAAGLMYAHRHWIVHRDLKPANILLDEEGNAYLADFGIARDLSAPMSGDQPQLMATVDAPVYLSPEQIHDEPITPQTDIYSLGMLLHELLAGTHPFADRQQADILHWHLHEPLPPLRLRRPDLPDALDAVIQTATAKHPADRYSDVVGLVADFRRASAMGQARPLLHSPALPADATRTTLKMMHPTARTSATLAATMRSVNNPYKGLRAFTEADEAEFFGRAALIQHLLERLAASGGKGAGRFLAVVGPSGSGKSSVVQAGLVPALRRGELPGSERWLVSHMVPGSRPLEELEAALLRVAVNPPASLLTQLQEDDRGLARAIKRTLPGDIETELVLVIDQFEELFTLVADEAARLHLLNSLQAAVAGSDSRVRVIITLRADFYDRPLLYPEFGDLIRQGTEVVLPLTAEELRQAIVYPAERVGVTLEADLLATVVQDVGKQPGALPLLQYALTELFERRAGHVLTLDTYDASGGVLGALARRAEEIYADLDAQQQIAVRLLFLQLVTPTEGMEDTRRRVLRSELTALTNDERRALNDEGAVDRSSFVVHHSSLMEKVIDIYGKYRLLTFDRDPITRRPTVEVAHEALLRAWGRLHQWLDASREERRLRWRLGQSAAEWSTAMRDPSFLATGARLTQFEFLLGPPAHSAVEAQEGGHLALSAEERAFLEASMAERDRQVAAERERHAYQARLMRHARIATVRSLAMARLARASALEARNLALVAGAQAALSEGNTDLALTLALTASRMEHPLIQAQLTLAEAAYTPGTRRRFLGHSASVTAVAFSPEGRMAISASEDRTLTLWDIASGQAIRGFQGHDDKINAVAFSPDGRTALSGADDRTLCLWDVAADAALHRFQGHDDKINAVAFSPDGRTALSGSTDTNLILWDIAGGQAIRRFRGHSDKVNAVAFSPDGRTALSASDDRTLVLWDIAGGQAIQRFRGHSDKVNAVAFSPDGRTALSGAEDTTLKLWNLATGQAHLLGKQTEGVFSVAFGSDGRTAISGSRDTTIGLWDVVAGKPIRFLIGHGGSVQATAFTPDGRTVLSGSADTTLRLWDIHNGAEMRRFVGHSAIVRCVAFGPSGRTILSCSDDASLILWDVVDGQPIRRFQGHTDAVNSLVFSSDERAALSASGDRTLMLWDIATGQPIRRMAGHAAGVTSVVLSPDGATALSGSLDKTLMLWDIASGQPIRRLQGHTDNVYRSVFSPDGCTVLSASGDRTLILWDSATGQIIRRFQGHTAAVRDVAFSADGMTALSGSDDATLMLWDVATGKLLHLFTSHHAKVYGVAMHPDGQMALSASADMSVILWDVTTAQPIRRFQGHTATVRSVEFSPDGRTYVSSSLDTTVRLWRIDSLEQLITWTMTNRYVPELTDEQRKLYRLNPA
jgi:WD40 repeat protein/serine/threonine protein kinase/DNA-binding XRE family transcriptional regulator